MTTIISHDKTHIVHGVFEYWCDSHGGFRFDAPGFRHQYCNTDWWSILHNYEPIRPTGRFIVCENLAI